MKYALTLLASFACMLPTLTNGEWKSFVQQKQANLVVWFHGWNKMRIAKPPVEKRDVSRDRLISFVRQSEISRNLAVVIIDKRISLSKSDLDEVTATFHSLLFKRVIIQQAVGDIGHYGLPILVDSFSTEQGAAANP